MAACATAPELKAVLWKDLLENETTEDVEYLAATRSYIQCLRREGIIPNT